jgi:hypothetical protein
MDIKPLEPKVRIPVNVNGDSADGERCYNFVIAG